MFSGGYEKENQWMIAIGWWQVGDPNLKAGEYEEKEKHENREKKRRDGEWEWTEWGSCKMEAGPKIVGVWIFQHRFPLTLFTGKIAQKKYGSVDLLIQCGALFIGRGVLVLFSQSN